ncbi:MAG: CRISPR-associated endonuclease Cas1 [Saprospiraceae bacterium]|nr:CRISPR-associated endonuclease Cas1 [Saprospiraceae bacterium]
MHVFIEEYGVKLDIEEEMLRIVYGEIERKSSFLKISSINILKPATVTTAVLCAAANHQVPVLMYSNTGRVEAWVWSPKYANIAQLRKQQVYFCDGPDCLKWVTGLLDHKCRHQIQNLRWLADRVSSAAWELQRIMIKMEHLRRMLAEAKNQESIRGCEGAASKWYWSGVSIGMNKYIKFEGREKRRAKDQFNQSLNYMYGILYGMVESSLLMYGLDPYMGLLHAIQYDKPSLVFDQIEPFRPWVDKMLMQLYIQKRIPQEIREGDLSLSLAHRKILIGQFFKEMDQRSLLNAKRIKKIDHIHHLSQKLVRTIRGEE